MKRTIVILAALVVVLGGLFYYFFGAALQAPGQTPAGQPALVALNADNFPAIKQEFNDSRNSVRVILLLSPT